MISGTNALPTSIMIIISVFYTHSFIGFLEKYFPESI